MENILIKDFFGNEIFSRSNIKLIKEILNKETKVLDFQGISFISRSVADELLNIIKDYTELELLNLQPEVKTMIEVVRKSRISNNRKINNAKIRTTYYCDTIDEVKNALLSRQTFNGTNQTHIINP